MYGTFWVGKSLNPRVVDKIMWSTCTMEKAHSASDLCNEPISSISICVTSGLWKEGGAIFHSTNCNEPQLGKWLKNVSHIIIIIYRRSGPIVPPRNVTSPFWATSNWQVNNVCGTFCTMEGGPFHKEPANWLGKSGFEFYLWALWYWWSIWQWSFWAPLKSFFLLWIWTVIITHPDVKT